MIDLDITFEQSPWERYVSRMDEGDVIGAAHLLALLEEENEDGIEAAFQTLEDMTAHLDLSDLPGTEYLGKTGTRLAMEAQLAKSGDFLQELGKTDYLRMYLEEIAAIPVCGDIVALASDMALANRQGKPDEQLRLRVMNLSMSRVVELAREHTGYGVLMSDLIQEGSLGLWKSTERFAGRGEYYEMIRDWWIRFYLGKAVILQARENGVGQKMRRAMEDYRTVDERLLSELGRNPTLQEIAEGLHMSAEEAEILKKMIDNARLLKQAKPEEEPEEDEFEAVEETRHVEDTALFQMRQRIMDLLSGLNEEDAKLLTLRFGLEGGSPLDPEETGRRLGLTPQEVVSREAAALALLRNG